MARIAAKKAAKTAKTKPVKAEATAAAANETPQIVEEAPKAYIVIDHPSNNSAITQGHYTFRIGTSENCQEVELSIDDQPWLKCRHAVGYWWFDWHGGELGSHQAVARAALNNGEILVSRRRRFKIV